jgi:hypothetical protein
MRFFTSFYFVQNDNKLSHKGHLGGVVWRQSRQTTPPKYKTHQEPVIPMRSEESHEINRQK